MPPLRLTPFYSWHHAIVLILVYIAAIVATMVMLVSIIVKLMVIGIILFIAWWEMSLHVWRNVSLAIVEAVWDQNGEWLLTLVSGKIIPAKLMGNSVVTPFLIILKFSIPSSLLQRSLVLTPSNCDAELLRRLRVRLRLEYNYPTPDPLPHDWRGGRSLICVIF